jgi:ssDNA-binding replication factor A large subunit
VTKIGELKQGMKGVTVQGRIIRIDKAQRVKTAEGQTIVSNAIIADASGVIKIPLWGDDAKKFKVNQEIKIENAFVSSYRGEPQLSVRFGKMSKLREG